MTKTYKIAVVTATRAEYGQLMPLMRNIDGDDMLKLQLIVTGEHLSEKRGRTVKFILEDGFEIAHQIRILEDGNTPYDISATMANAVKGFAACFRDDRPDMLVILGDRTEMLGVASAAMNERIPVAHIHGGEITQGAVDDCVRHALTKMSYLHFTATESYRKRVIQLGEAPDRVFCTGALGVENIRNMKLLNEQEVRQELGIAGRQPYAVVTFHPVTLEAHSASGQTHELCRAMDAQDAYFYLMTGANADAGGDIVNQILRTYADRHENAVFIQSLGTKRYLSAVRYAAFVLGNSSSGLLEAPVLGVPSVNIGDRQKGRLHDALVTDCIPKWQEIVKAVRKAEAMPHVPSGMYGDGNVSEQMIKIMKDFMLHDRIHLKKGFYDMETDL